MNDLPERRTTFDPLATITGLVLSPFRLPPAARPLLGRSERKATRKLRKQEKKRRSTVGGIGSAVGTNEPFIPTPLAKPQQSPWDRASQTIKAGVPGTPDGGPPPAEVGTAVLMGQPGIGMVADAQRRAVGVYRKDRKRQLVEIGMYLWRYGMMRGLFCALLVAGAVFLPAILPASWNPDGVSRDVAPWFLGGPLVEHYAIGSLAAIGLVGLAALALPGVLRGLVLVVIGCAPFAVYALARFGVVPEWSIPVPPPGLEGHTDLVLLLFPAWVALGAGMVAGQNFPDAIPGRLLAGVGGLVVLGQQIIGSGVLRQTIENRIVAIEGALAVLLFALALAAIGQFFRGNMAICISFVKAGMLMLVALPVLLAVWQWGGNEADRMPVGQWFEAFRSLIFIIACYLIAVVGLVEWLHRLAWRAEIRAKLGNRYARMNPATQEFAGQFMEYAHQSGVFSPDEMDVIRRQLQQRARSAQR